MQQFQSFFAIWSIFTFILIPVLLILLGKALHRARVAEAEVHLAEAENKKPSILHG